jgi:hypothetical protein
MALFNPQAPTRCKSIILDDTGIEVIVVDSVARTVSQEAFHQLVPSFISDTPGFFKAFGLTGALFSIAYRDAMRLPRCHAPSLQRAHASILEHDDRQIVRRARVSVSL